MKMTCIQCCQCTRAGHVKLEKNYNVRSVALRGDNDETLEVCLAAAEDTESQDTEDTCQVCTACPPACSDPNCVACLQKCPHQDNWPQQYPYKRHAKHPKYRNTAPSGHGACVQG